MKDYGKIVEALKICADDNFGCANCPYNDGDNGKCSNKMKLDALELIEEMKAQLEQPTTACDYEAISHKLEEELERVEIENERIQRELSEAQKELAYLRAVKATTEAFLGVKI